jgi:hypothetical protein
LNGNTLTGKSRALVLSVIGASASEANCEEARERGYE